MPSHAINRDPLALIKSSFNTMISHPAVLFPFYIIAFFQLLIIEIIFFSPRYPLSVVFKPLILRFEGPLFFHYPYNFSLLTKWFHFVQAPAYIIIHSFFIGMAVHIINLINNDQKIQIGKVFKCTSKSYVHLFIAAAVSIGALYGLLYSYGLLLDRAFQVQSTAGMSFFLKQAITKGAPFFNLLLNFLVTTAFAFVVPIIMIEQKKVFTAIVLNFQNHIKSFWFIFIVVSLSGLLYLPVMLLKVNGQFFAKIFVPEVWGILLIVSVIVTLFIDAIQYTAITTYYLLKKEVR